MFFCLVLGLRWSEGRSPQATNLFLVLEEKDAFFLPCFRGQSKSSLFWGSTTSPSFILFFNVFYQTHKNDIWNMCFWHGFGNMQKTIKITFFLETRNNTYYKTCGFFSNFGNMQKTLENMCFACFWKHAKQPLVFRGVPKCTMTLFVCVVWYPNLFVKMY